MVDEGFHSSHVRRWQVPPRDGTAHTANNTTYQRVLAEPVSGEPAASSAPTGWTEGGGTEERQGEPRGGHRRSHRSREEARLWNHKKMALKRLAYAAAAAVQSARDGVTDQPTPSEGTAHVETFIRRLEFVMAVSGEFVGTVESDCAFTDTEVFSRALNVSLRHFLVVDRDGEASPLHGYRIPHGTTEMSLVRKPLTLVNAWLLCAKPGHFKGQRKWCKEFRTFCADHPLCLPDTDFSTQDYPPSFCGIELQCLAPIILQMVVADIRIKPWSEHPSKWPALFRNRDGVIHSIIRMTNAKFDIVVDFIDKFLDVNPHLLDLVTAEVNKQPFQNYFL